MSYLGLGHVFTANMIGNIVLLGFGIVGSGGLRVVSPMVSLVAFLIGVGAGGALALKYAKRHQAHVSRALGIEVVLVLSAAVIAMLTGAVLLKSTLFLPLLAAGCLSLATWLVYVPAARGR